MLGLASPEVFIHCPIWSTQQMFVLYPADQSRVMNKCLRLETNHLHANVTVCHGKPLQTWKKLLIKWCASDSWPKTLAWWDGGLCCHCGGCGLRWELVRHCPHSPVPVLLRSGPAACGCREFAVPQDHRRFVLKISRCCANTGEKGSAPTRCCWPSVRSQPFKVPAGAGGGMLGAVRQGLKWDPGTGGWPEGFPHSSGAAELCGVKRVWGWSCRATCSFRRGGVK